ncbi:MAG: TolC family protein [Bacteroidota bacterium]
MKPALFLAFSIHFLVSNAQTDTVQLSLPEIVALAQSDAPEALLAETRMKNRFWSYKSVLADFKPAISFNGDLPDLNRSIGQIILPSGTSTFVQQSYIRNSVGLDLRQSIVATGGTVFLGTGLERLDILVPKAPNTKSYFSTPISFGFIQPIFGFNELKWDKKIEPLRYQEATRQYAEQMEEVALNSADLFFDVFISQLNLQAARQDKANADTQYGISKGRFEVGRVAETELLQIELSSMNSDAAVQQALLDLQSGTERLRNFLGIRQSTYFDLAPPTAIPYFTVDAELALRLAKENRSEIIAFQRRLAEADQAVAQAKANSGLQLNLSGFVSLSKTAEELKDVYQDPDHNERLHLGVSVPIADWGKAQSRLEVATTNREFEIMNVEQDRINFEQEILLKVKQFDLVRNQAALALRAYGISQKREEMTRNRYYIGKIGVTDLGIAISEKEGARRSYMSALQSFWLAYYDLRRITLYDFERGVSLVKRVEGY